jgi:hypothetical protein
LERIQLSNQIMSKKSSLILLGIFSVLFVIFVVVDTKKTASKISDQESGSVVAMGTGDGASPESLDTVSVNQSNSGTFEDVEDADQVVVVHFRGTYQCWSCVKLGELALATIEERFSSELNEDKILFLEINGELPENRELVQLYQARGSSLFLNAIKDEENHIREEVKIWQLLSQEEKFKDYLEREISKVL